MTEVSSEVAVPALVTDEIARTQEWLVDLDTIETDDQYKVAGSTLLACKSLRDEIGRTFDPIVSKAHQAHKEATSQRRRHLEPVQAIETRLRALMGAYSARKERAAREESARIAAEARKRDEESRLAEAAALEEAGRKEEAEAVLDLPAPPPPPPVVQKPKAEGVTMRETWSAEVYDLAALVAAAAGGKAAISLLKPDTTALNRMAQALKGELEVPGVRVVCKKVPVVTGR